ncbi:MAG: peptide chain release factor N(5)-glutamine methyltransferase [Ignavibacteriaceae bacterium]|nr:peptide chain release factor N(5)-glutamine methyltransferase [Ignavibacteriaceae bacterium]
MPTILELITLTTEYFEKKEIDSPRINAELLLADILKCKRLDLYLSFDKPLEEKEINLYREYVRRRAKYEPLQYIVGKVEFYGFEFVVNPNVLIPRQETEILVESVIELLKVANISSGLDIGTGSGIIPISVCRCYDNIYFDALDISSEALEVAKKNSIYNGTQQRINFELNDILQKDIRFHKKYDLVVSNPPYVAQSEYASLQKEITDYEPKIAVTDFSDGYSFYKKISEIAIQILNEKGFLIFEVGKGQSEFVSEIMRGVGFSSIKIVKDYSNIERVIQGQKI